LCSLDRCAGDGPPSIIIIIGAPERLKAREHLVDILDSVEGVTENLRVLPVDKSAGKELRRNSAVNQNVRGKLKEEVIGHV
jgi:hypothetical protein